MTVEAQVNSVEKRLMTKIAGLEDIKNIMRTQSARESETTVNQLETQDNVTSLNQLTTQDNHTQVNSVYRPFKQDVAIISAP